MPQLTLKHATIADVITDPEDASKRIIKVNLNEEDWFEVLDHLNPKNLIKYLDMRNIPHREAMQVNIVESPHHKMAKRNKQKIGRVVDYVNSVLKHEGHL